MLNCCIIIFSLAFVHKINIFRYCSIIYNMFLVLILILVCTDLVWFTTRKKLLQSRESLMRYDNVYIQSKFYIEVPQSMSYTGFSRSMFFSWKNANHYLFSYSRPSLAKMKMYEYFLHLYPHCNKELVNYKNFYLILRYKDFRKKSL